MWRLGEADLLFSALPEELGSLSFPVSLEDDGHFIGFTPKEWSPNDLKVYGLKKYILGKLYN
jgi:hypothetical protein